MTPAERQQFNETVIRGCCQILREQGQEGIDEIERDQLARVATAEGEGSDD